MLIRLHGHVECEELRWSSHVQNLQQQLDVAINKLNARNLQRIRQKSQEHSANENKDSEDKCEVDVVTAK